MERDAIEPGAQTGFAMEAANAAEDLDEDFLGDVGGVGGVVEAAARSASRAADDIAR